VTIAHDMPNDQFTALAKGGGGVAAVRKLVAAQHSRHLILLHGVFRAIRNGDQCDVPLAVAGFELLSEVQRLSPGPANAVITYPSVGAWALHTLRDDQTVPGARHGGLAAVAAAAAIKAEIAAEIEVPVTNGQVVLPSLGVADAQGDTAVVRTSPPEIRSGGRRVTLAPGAVGWHGLRRLRVGPLHVVIDDLDPFRMPATDGEPAGRLTHAQFLELEATLRDAWAVIDPASSAEIAAIVQVIVPYQGTDHGWVSTSSPQTFGTVAMSRQPDPYTCAETLVHEAQHLKLSALLDLVPLTVPDDGRRYYAPWRNDPRPASSLLQGAYAFLGVSSFWRRHAAAGQGVRLRAEVEFTRWRDGCAVAVDTLLASAQLTPAGQDFVTEMSRVLQDWKKAPVSREALDIARRHAELHLARWRMDNPCGTAIPTSGVP
jgi:uncharacterized protein